MDDKLYEIQQVQKSLDWKLKNVIEELLKTNDRIDSIELQYIDFDEKTDQKTSELYFNQQEIIRNLDSITNTVNKHIKDYEKEVRSEKRKQNRINTKKKYQEIYKKTRQETLCDM